jgi:uncharacterized Zn-binding protein involved in type VI secretion
MPPVATIGDLHACPMQTPTPGGPVPHAVGPIQGPGAATVMMGNKPPALVGDMVMCVTPGGPAPIDSIVKGSTTVLVCNKPVARVGDSCAHGGSITGPGVPTVMIGG